MLGNSAIQILRGTSDKIKNTTAPLLPGQLLYDMNNDYLYCGNNDYTPVNELTPLATDRLHSNSLGSMQSSVQCYSNAVNINSGGNIYLIVPANSYNKVSISGNVDITDGLDVHKNLVVQQGAIVSSKPTTTTGVARWQEILDLNHTVDVTNEDTNAVISSVAVTNGKITTTTSNTIQTAEALTLQSTENWLHLNARSNLQLQTDSAINLIANGSGLSSYAGIHVTTNQIYINQSSTLGHNSKEYSIYAGNFSTTFNAAGNLLTLRGYSKNASGSPIAGKYSDLLTFSWTPNFENEDEAEAEIVLSSRLNLKTDYLTVTNLEVSHFNFKGAPYKAAYYVPSSNGAWQNCSRYRHIGAVTICKGNNKNNETETYPFFIETPFAFYNWQGGGSSDKLGNLQVVHNSLKSIENIYSTLKSYGGLQCWVNVKGSWTIACLNCMTNYKSFCTQHSYIEDYYPSWLWLDIYYVDPATKNFATIDGHVVEFIWASSVAYMDDSPYNSLNLLKV